MNIFIKCIYSRCIFTNVNPETAERHPKHEPLETLKKYRAIAPETKSPAMGIHLGIRVEGKISINDDVFIEDESQSEWLMSIDKLLSHIFVEFVKKNCEQKHLFKKYFNWTLDIVHFVKQFFNSYNINIYFDCFLFMNWIEVGSKYKHTLKHWYIDCKQKE